MKKKLMMIALIAAVLAMTAAPVFAGAWTRAKGSSYNRVSINYYFSDENYINDSDRLAYPENGEFEDYYANYYLEYGFTDRLTAIGSFNYKWLKKEDDTIKMETWGVGDADVAVKYRLYDGFGVCSVQGLYKIAAFYDEDDRLPLGNGQSDFELRLMYGKSLYPFIPGYCNFEAGYRWRNSDPSDEFHFLGEVGIDFTETFYSRVKLDAIFAVDDNDGTISPAGNPTKTDAYDLIKLDIAGGWKLSDQWGFELAYTPSIYGQWTAAGATYTAAVVFETE
ncbi:MAG: hypothetical protein ACQERN_03255 [Thermodesulfobacteriota bacterium]